MKLPAVSSADYTAVAALLQQLLAAVVFAGSEIITISPSLRSGEIMHETVAAQVFLYFNVFGCLDAGFLDVFRSVKNATQD